MACHCHLQWTMFCQRVKHNWVTELILILNLPSSLSVASWIKSLLCLNTSSQTYWPIMQWAEWAWTQFSSVTQSCPTLWDPMDYSMPGFAVHHQLPELAQTHVHQVSDAIQPSHLQLFPSPLDFNLSQYSVFSNKLAFLIRWPQYWSFSFSISPSNEYSGLLSFRTCWISLQFKGLWRVFSTTTVQKHQFLGTLLSSWSNSHIYAWLLEKS